MLLNCDVGEDFWESLGLQGDPTSPFYRRSVLGVHWKDWCWSWNANILATWCEELTHLKRPWCWEKIEGRRRRGWQRMRWLDGIPTQWTWVWVNSGSWWWTGRPGMLQSWGCKELDTTEQLNWTDKKFLLVHLCFVLVNRNFNCMKPVMWDLAYAVLKDCISKKKFEQKFRWFLMKKDKMY